MCICGGGILPRALVLLWSSERVILWRFADIVTWLAAFKSRVCSGGWRLLSLLPGKKPFERLELGLFLSWKQPRRARGRLWKEDMASQRRENNTRYLYTLPELTNSTSSNYPCISCEGARGQLSTNHTQTPPPVSPHPLAPQWKTQQPLNKSLNSYKLLSLRSVSEALTQSMTCPLLLSPCPTAAWLGSTLSFLY